VSICSSETNIGGSKSTREEKSCPILTKLGPSSARAFRRFDARAASKDSKSSSRFRNARESSRRPIWEATSMQRIATRQGCCQQALLIASGEYLSGSCGPCSTIGFGGAEVANGVARGGNTKSS